jgi:predicted DsbA family dithiol-disulfide isomerase
MFASANSKKRWSFFLSGAAQAQPVTPPVARPIPGEAGWAPQSGVVWYWYDFVCPFSYVGQHRPDILRRHGLEVIELPFQNHPGIPPGGIASAPLDDGTKERITEEAEEAGLEVRWPTRLPSSRMALAAAEWVRVNEPSAFVAFQGALFRAHFALGEDIESVAVIEAHASATGVYIPFLRNAISNGSAEAAVARARRSALSIGVRGARKGLERWSVAAGVFLFARIDA